MSVDTTHLRAMMPNPLLTVQWHVSLMLDRWSLSEAGSDYSTSDGRYSSRRPTKALLGRSGPRKVEVSAHAALYRVRPDLGLT